ncbi:GNAT family N-acetyltransferase [Phascolarctobacterium sp.]
MDFRIINDETLPKIMELWDYCFEKNDTPFFKWYFDEYCLKENMILGGFDEADGSLMNMLHLNPYTINLRGQELQVPYIVGVATAPEYRGRHLFGPLLDTAFAVLRAQKQAFVLLMPISAGIYRPYQFDYCYYRHRYEMPLAVLPKAGSVSADITLQRAGLEQEAEAFAKVYAAVTAAYHGAVKRDDKNWRNLLSVHQGEQVKAVLAKRGGQVLGYMLYNIADRTFTVQELLAEETAARDALLRFARGHVTEAEKFNWLAEAWDKMYLHLQDQNYAGSLQPFMMARCINVRQALVQLTNIAADIQGAVSLLITDKTLPLNNGLLKLEVNAGQIDVKSTVDMQDIEMDVAAFTQLYFGQFSVQELAAENRLKIHNEEAALLLDRLFPKCHNYINEYF